MTVILTILLETPIKNGINTLLSVPTQPFTIRLPSFDIYGAISLAVSFIIVFFVFELLDRKNVFHVYRTVWRFLNTTVAKTVWEPPTDTPNMASFDDKFEALKNADTPNLRKKLSEEFRARLASLYSYSASWSRSMKRRALTVLDFIEKEMPNAGITDKENYVDWIDLLIKDKKIFKTAKKKFQHTIEEFYHSPDFENSVKVLTVLQEFYEYDENFMKNLVDDAIHKWSDARFQNHYGTIRLENVRHKDQQAFQHLRQNLRQKMADAEKNKDMKAYSRAEKLYEVVRPL